MEFERADVTRYLYTAGVLVSGVYLERWFTAFGATTVLGIGSLVAAVWTLYYRVMLVEKLDAMRDGNETGRGRVERRENR